MKNPKPLRIRIADTAGGVWPGALQIIAALYQKQNTGEGYFLDISMAKGASSILLLEYAA